MTENDIMTVREGRWIVRAVWGCVLVLALVAAFLAGRACAIHEDLVRAQAEWAAGEPEIDMAGGEE